MTSGAFGLKESCCVYCSIIHPKKKITKKERMCQLRYCQRRSNANADIVCYHRGNNCADDRRLTDKYSGALFH